MRVFVPKRVGLWRGWGRHFRRNFIVCSGLQILRR